jgi:Acetyltransferase (GNAT) domain
MRSNTIGAIANRSPSKLHRAKDHFAAQPQFARNNFNNHRNPNFAKSAVNFQRTGQENGPINSLWVIKIGDRIVGMTRLVQDGPHSAEIVLFRVDPEWSHTKVPLNLIRSVESFCKKHGRLEVSMQPHTAPPWIMSLMNHHGFRFTKEKQKS